MATSLLIFCLCMFKTNSKDSSFQLFKHFQADIKPWLITYLCILIICLYNSKVERHLCLMCVCDLVWSDLATSESLAHHSVTSRKTWIHSPSYPTLQNTPKTVFLWGAHAKKQNANPPQGRRVMRSPGTSVEDVYRQFRLTGIFLLHKVYRYKYKICWAQLNSNRTLTLRLLVSGCQIAFQRF